VAVEAFNFSTVFSHNPGDTSPGAPLESSTLFDASYLLRRNDIDGQFRKLPRGHLARSVLPAAPGVFSPFYAHNARIAASVGELKVRIHARESRSYLAVFGCYATQARWIGPNPEIFVGSSVSIYNDQGVFVSRQAGQTGTVTSANSSIAKLLPGQTVAHIFDHIVVGGRGWFDVVATAFTQNSFQGTVAYQGCTLSVFDVGEYDPRAVKVEQII
jgi:hypothetical protein